MSALIDSRPRFLDDLVDRVPFDPSDVSELVDVSELIDAVADTVDLEQVADAMTDAAEAVAGAALVAGRRTTRIARRIGSSAGRGIGAGARTVRRHPRASAVVGLVAVAGIAGAVVATRRARRDEANRAELHLADAA